MKSHGPVDPFDTDLPKPLSLPSQIHYRRDPSISLCRPFFDNLSDHWQMVNVIGPRRIVRPSSRFSSHPFMLMGSGNVKCLSYRFHRIISFGDNGMCNISFFHGRCGDLP
jgi:hypothetical protein